MPRIGSKPPALPKTTPSKPKTQKAPKKPGFGKKPPTKPVE
jgi:hypothetical protein